MPIDADVGLILLAAGRSSRFGGDKLHAEFRGKPLYAWAVAAARDAGFADKFLVTRSAEHFAVESGWQIVENPRADEGMASSIVAGVEAARGVCDRLVIALADMPFVSAVHLSSLAQCNQVTFTRYPDGRAGCPAMFPATAFDKLKRLRGDRGASSTLFPDAMTIEAAPGELDDIDTPRDLAAHCSADSGGRARDRLERVRGIEPL